MMLLRAEKAGSIGKPWRKGSLKNCSRFRPLGPVQYCACLLGDGSRGRVKVCWFPAAFFHPVHRLTLTRAKQCLQDPGWTLPRQRSIAARPLFISFTATTAWSFGLEVAACWRAWESLRGVFTQHTHSEDVGTSKRYRAGETGL